MGDQTALRPPTASELGASGIPSEIGMASESTARPHTTRFSLKVIRANGVTSLQFANGIKWLPSSNNRRFLVTATDGATTNTTADVKSEGKSVVWDVTLGEFRVEPGSNLTLRLVAKRRLHSDVLVGAVELPFESLCASFPREVTIVAGESITTRSTQVTLSVEIAVRELLRVVSTGNSRPTTPLEEGDIQTRTRNVLSRADKATVSMKFPSRLLSLLMGKADQAPNQLSEAGELFVTWKKAVSKIQWVVDITEGIAEIHPYAKMAWSILFFIPKTFLSQVKRDANILALLGAIHDSFDLLEEASFLEAARPRSRQAQILKDMLRHVCDCGDFIQTYAQNTEFRSRLWENVGRGVDRRIWDYCTRLEDLRKDLLRHAVIVTEGIVLNIKADFEGMSTQIDQASTRLDGISRQLEDVLSVTVSAGVDALIREIPYPSGASFLSEKGCLAGTRTAFLDYITNWVNDPNSTRGLVLFGQAGKGKSSIAHEVARRFGEMRRLASSFIFLRGEQTNREPHLLFTGLARDLSDRHPAFRSCLGRTVQNDTCTRRGTKDLSRIFKSLLLQPLADAAIVGPIFVVIDALDEASGVTGRSGLHTFLADHIRDLPPNFRILITSRPEHDIECAFRDVESVGVKWMDDPELSAASEKDIHAYLKHNLPADLYREHGEKFARKAEGLFQWAAAACRYIQEPPSGLTEEDIVQCLLEPSPGHHPLDALYVTILKSYFNLDDSRIRRRYQSVMGQLFSAFEPLSSLSLTNLRRYSYPDEADNDNSVSVTVRNLGSLLSNVAPADSGRPITPLHTSFRDFLTSKDRAGEFWIDVAASHRQMAYCCLGLLIGKLHFNMCNLVSSNQKNSDVPDIHSLVSHYISRALSYASRFWDHHLRHVPFHTDFVKKLQALLLTKFPFWLESFSLLGCIDLALQALSTLKEWLPEEQSEPIEEVRSLLAFVDDASAFVRYFAMPMSQSAPHIYLSALPFSPASSLVLQRYAKMFPNTIALERGRLAHWPAQEIVIGVGAICLSVAFSPDGTRVASGLSDGTIHMYSSSTGQEIRGPFNGHEDWVRSVVFSPDGRQLVSGSDDGTVRMWDTATGEAVSEPFAGDTGWVHAVAVSLDGRYVVSGSGDRTIRVWDVSTGSMFTKPFTGHAGPVKSVAFSPDGLNIVSGSDDKTVRVWSVTTGELVAGPLEGHTYSINSVTFSPDGQYIVSGSEDHTIRIWNATTGGSVAAPLQGHTDSITSVVVSQQYIISCSADSTIRVWDSTTRLPIGEPLTGHGNAVRSIALSSDGRHVVSGSEDKTVRIWDIFVVRSADPAMQGPVERDLNISLSQNIQRVIPQLEGRTVDAMGAAKAETSSGSLGGHTDGVWSVASSPDGRLVASGSVDRTIRIWDATTGRAMGEPLTGHTDEVSSVAFSPDSQRIASGSHDRTILVWDVTTGQVVVELLEGHQDMVFSVAFSPDGQWIASGSIDETICVWDTATGKASAEPFTGHTDAIQCIAFSPNGQSIASGSQDRTIRVWDARTGLGTAGPFTGHTNRVFSVTFSPDGRYIASTSHDHSVRIWDATTGRPAADPFKGVNRYPYSVSFSPDGRHIVSGWSDGAIRILDTRTGHAVSDPLIGHTGTVTSVAYSADGRRIISGSSDTSVRLWTTPTNDASATHASSSDDSRASHHDSGTPVPIEFRTDKGFAIDDDGWIRGSGGELVVWIPEPHRVGLPRPNNVWVRAKHETVLDSTHFVHGLDWATCYKAD